MAEPLVTIMAYARDSQAQYHRELLENAGLKPVIVQDESGEPPEELTLSQHGGPMLLQVPESQVKTAGEVLEEYLSDEMEETGGNPAQL